MQRRGFLSAILGAAAAPAIVSASSLMKIIPVKPETLIYKATGRYDLSLQRMEEWVKDADGLVALRPTRLIVPATLQAECLKILNAEFDKQYAMTTRRII